MKKAILYCILFMLNCLNGSAQEIINMPGTITNESIQQIRSSGIDNILGFQTLNRGIGNYAILQQTGNQNKATISQQNDAGQSMGNQSQTVQSGNSNEMTIGQIGSGNLLLGFQLGYLTTKAGKQQLSQIGVENNNVFASGFPNEGSGFLVGGDRNKLKVSQEGNNNGVLAVQQGVNNNISAGQIGNKNYLLLMQLGKNNSITGYVQENLEERPNYDAIIQIGNDISLTASDFSKSKPNGNSFRQEGENLSLQINNQFANTLGGIEISQTGKDMKVVVDQSYFSKPMK